MAISDLVETEPKQQKRNVLEVLYERQAILKRENREPLYFSIGRGSLSVLSTDQWATAENLSSGYNN
jgi:hypothetical protein